jgi:hypothetical protein
VRLEDKAQVIKGEKWEYYSNSPPNSVLTERGTDKVITQSRKTLEGSVGFGRGELLGEGPGIS